MVILEVVGLFFGVTKATQNHTLVRKCSVEHGNSDWIASAGTSI